MLASALSMILSKKTVDGIEVKPTYGLTLIIVGFVEGIVTGIVGAGGGFLIIPALVLLGKLPMKKQLPLLYLLSPSNRFLDLWATLLILRLTFHF